MSLYRVNIEDAPKGSYTKVRDLLTDLLDGTAGWDYGKPIFEFSADEDQASLIEAHLEDLEIEMVEVSKEEPVVEAAPEEEPVVEAAPEEEPVVEAAPEEEAVVEVVPEPIPEPPPPPPPPQPKFKVWGLAFSHANPHILLEDVWKGGRSAQGIYNQQRAKPEFRDLIHHVSVHAADGSQVECWPPPKE